MDFLEENGISVAFIGLILIAMVIAQLPLGCLHKILSSSSQPVLEVDVRQSPSVYCMAAEVKPRSPRTQFPYNPFPNLPTYTSGATGATGATASGISYSPSPEIV